MINSVVLSFIFWVSMILLTSYLLSIFLIGIEQNTNVSSGIIGVILLPIVTSLPEIVSAIGSPLITDAKYATFNMLGSNTLTQTALVFAFIIFFNKKIYKRFSKTNIETTKLLIFLSIIITLPLFLNKLHITFFNASIQLWIFLIAYIIYVIRHIKDDEEQPDQKKVPFNKWQSIIGFILFALLLTYSSIKLLKVADLMAQPETFKNINISQSVVGTLFLSLATTLPEILTYYWILRLNYYSIAINGILGSDLFNIAILAIADIFVIKESAFGFVYGGGWNTIIGRKFIFTAPAYLLMLWLVSKKRKANQALSVLVAIATFILFLWSFKVF